MTNAVVRLYALAATLIVFFVSWAAIAARPWQASADAGDPRLAELALREQELRREAITVAEVVDRRWAVYQAKLNERRRENAGIRRQAELAAARPAASPQVQVVTLPPATRTGAS